MKKVFRVIMGFFSAMFKGSKRNHTQSYLNKTYDYRKKIKNIIEDLERGVQNMRTMGFKYGRNNPNAKQCPVEPQLAWEETCKGKSHGFINSHE